VSDLANASLQIVEMSEPFLAIARPLGFWQPIRRATNERFRDGWQIGVKLRRQ
jgi:hypothetical protein